MSVSFPAPVGGVSFEEDFVPCVVFAGAFAILIAAGVYRLAKPATRTLVTLGPLIFCVERVVTWSLRANQSKTPSADFSKALTIYFQVTLAVGYISPLWGCLLNLLRCVYVATTQGSRSSSQISLREYGRQGTTESDRESEGQMYAYDAPPMQQDRPRARYWYRRMFDGISLLQWIPVATGTTVGNLFWKAQQDPSKTQMVQILRYVTAITSLVLVCILNFAIAYAYIIVKGKNRRGICLLFIVTGLLIAIADYDLVVMKNWTTSLTSKAPGSQNTPSEKIAFYIIRAAPEVLIAGSLLILDVRNIFGTGLKGDPFSDPKPQSEPSENQAGSVNETPREPPAWARMSLVLGLVYKMWARTRR